VVIVSEGEEGCEMCPLRPLLFIVSALVALAVLLLGRHKTEEEADEELRRRLGGASGHGEQEGKEIDKPKASIVDFFTGRYLINKFRSWRSSGSLLEEKLVR